MGRIPDEIIQQVRDRADVVELVGRTVSLKRAGRNYKGLCPFHDEKSPSFNVNPDRGTYYCFGCQEGGDVFAFLMKIENLTFVEVVRSLARDCGIEVPESGGEGSGVSERVFAANDVAQSAYLEAFAVAGNPGEAYLGKRGLAAEDAERFGIGYAPDSWDHVARALQSAKIPAELGEKSGLLAPRNRGDGFYDRLRGRLTFPIQDARGRVVGFGGRALAADQEPKYLNTPETPVFRKREAFYGLPHALVAIRERDRAIVVEGYFDRIALSRAGLDEALATCGTSLTEGHARNLRRRTRNVVLLFDGDEAGRRAVERSLEILLPAGLRVLAALLPAGDDPDTLLAREGPQALRDVVEGATPALEFAIERAVATGCDTPWAKADAVAAVAPVLSLIPSAVERSEFCKRLALAVGTEARHVEAAVAAAARGEDARDAVPVAPRALGPEERQLKQVAISLFDHPHLSDRVPAEELDRLPEGPSRQIVAAIVRGTDGTLDVERLAQQLPDEGRMLLRELAVRDDAVVEDAAIRTITDTLAAFRKRRERLERRQVTQQLRGSPENARALLVEKQEQIDRRKGTSHTPVGTSA